MNSTVEDGENGYAQAKGRRLTSDETDLAQTPTSVLIYTRDFTGLNRPATDGRRRRRKKKVVRVERKRHFS